MLAIVGYARFNSSCRRGRGGIVARGRRAGPGPDPPADLGTETKLHLRHVRFSYRFVHKPIVKFDLVCNNLVFADLAGHVRCFMLLPTVLHPVNLGGTMSGSRSLTHSLTRPPTHSFTDFIPQPTNQGAHSSLTHSLTSYPNQPTKVFTHPTHPTHPITHALTHSRTHSLTHSRTHSILGSRSTRWTATRRG